MWRKSFAKPTGARTYRLNDKFFFFQKKKGEKGEKKGRNKYKSRKRK